MKKIFLNFSTYNIRQKILGECVKAGLRHVGWKQVLTLRDADLQIMWGAQQADFSPAERGNKPFLVMDFPYWNRRNKNYLHIGHYKISLNSIHPTDYLDRAYDGPGRFKKTGGGVIKPWRESGDYILIAGMGPKGCHLYNYGHGQWDEQAALKLREFTDEKIIYRPKPSDRRPIRIAGCHQDDEKTSIGEHLLKARAIITHHGNTAVEALIAGVAPFCINGPASMIANTDLTKIKNPVYSDQREIFLDKLAYWQWSYSEISIGEPFKHL